MFGLISKSAHDAIVAAKDAKIAALKEGSRIIREERNLAAAERDEARAALIEISGQETPYANATVKRMAARARLGLRSDGAEAMKGVA